MVTQTLVNIGSGNGFLPPNFDGSVLLRGHQNPPNFCYTPEHKNINEKMLKTKYDCFIYWIKYFFTQMIQRGHFDLYTDKCFMWRTSRKARLILLLALLQGSRHPKIVTCQIPNSIFCFTKSIKVRRKFCQNPLAKLTILHAPGH